MAGPQGMIVPLLRELQTDLAAFRKETGGPLTKWEVGQRNLRSAMAGETVLGRILVGEYEERIEALEEKVRGLETRK